MHKLLKLATFLFKFNIFNFYVSIIYNFFRVGICSKNSRLLFRHINRSINVGLLWRIIPGLDYLIPTINIIKIKTEVSSYRFSRRALYFSHILKAKYKTAFSLGNYIAAIIAHINRSNQCWVVDIPAFNRQWKSY